MKKIFLAGEGPNELGSWHSEREQRVPGKEYLGTIETLLRKVNPAGGQVIDGTRWKNVRKYPAPSCGAEERNVRGAAQMARDAGCDVLAFTRDRDKPENIDRQKDIERGIAAVQDDSKDTLRVIGGMAIERLESWLCALSGKTKSEKLRKTRVEEILREYGVDPKNTETFVKIVEDADLNKLPKDAHSLNRWLDAARAVLSDNE
jgi:hypothetical protein